MLIESPSDVPCAELREALPVFIPKMRDVVIFSYFNFIVYGISKSLEFSPVIATIRLDSFFLMVIKDCQFTEKRTHHLDTACLVSAN